MSELAPPSFKWEPVFVEIDSASHRMWFDLREDGWKHARVVSTVAFHVESTGQPIIDLSHANAIQSAQIGKQGQTMVETGYGRVASPDGQASYLVFREYVDAGEIYELELEQILDLSRPGNEAEACFFRMSHAKHYKTRSTDRLFLERYLPCNLEFDQHPMRLTIEAVEGPSLADLEVITNGHPVGATLVFDFADWYTCSCPFFFLGWKAKLGREQRDVAGVEVDLFWDAATQSQWDFADIWEQIEGAIQEVLDLYGDPFPHDGLKLYLGDHGIEYAGAAEISRSNARHEIIHQYFGRCVLPANGDAGWIDEAIAHWAVSGYRPYPTPPDRLSKMGGRSEYRRATDHEGRSLGPMLLGHFSYLIFEGTKSTGNPMNFQSFLRWWFGKNRAQTVTSKQFRDELAEWVKINVNVTLGSEIERLFDVYVFGMGPL